MKMSSLAAVVLAAATALPAAARELKPDELKKALKEHPEIILDFMKDNRKQVLDIVEQAAQEEQAQRQQEEADREKKEMDEAFQHPYQPEITDKSHVRGKSSAKYTLVEYSDFQCPFCGRGFHTVEDLRKKYGDSLRFVYKNDPLPFHPMAMPSAKWFEAVSMQSPEKAWKFHDTLFNNQDKLSPDFLKQTAKDLGINVKKAEEDANSQAVADRIQADIAEAKKFGFTGTPGFLLNGVPVRGAYPIDTFDGIIKRLDNGGKAVE